MPLCKNEQNCLYIFCPTRFTCSAFFIGIPSIMSTYSTHDFIREAEAQQKFYQEQAARFDAVLNDQAEQIATLMKKKDAALRAMSDILLPTFTHDDCTTLAKRLQKPMLEGLYADYLREQKSLQEQIANIEQNTGFQKRDALTNPKSGVLTTQIAELEPLYAQAETMLEKLRSMQGFERLQANKYGRKDYVHQGMMRFLTPEYYSDNADAAAIVKQMGVNDFLDVLSEYNTAQDRMNTLAPSLQRLREEYSALQNLAREHTQASERLAGLESIYKQRVQEAIAEYCTLNDKQTLARLFTEVAADAPDAYAPLESAFKQFDGTEHQIDYLRALRSKVTDDTNALVQKSTALAEETRRYTADPHRFRNKRWTNDQFAKKFKRDTTRYDRSLHRYNRTGAVIYGFDDYNRISPFEEFLWWDVMSDGRLDGNFIPEVQEYYETHPDYEYNPSDYAPTDGINTDNSDNS